MSCKSCKQLIQLRNSMIILGITGDTIFNRIQEDLDRGLVDSARSHLNFVDKIVKHEKT